LYIYSDCENVGIKNSDREFGLFKKRRELALAASESCIDMPAQTA
jgi:hypothetical protein